MIRNVLFIESSGSSYVETSGSIITNNENTSSIYIYSAEYISQSYATTKSLEEKREMLSAGLVYNPTYFDPVDGTLYINSNYVRFYDNANFSGSINEYFLPSFTASFVNDMTSYVIAKYNGGSPTYDVTAIITDANESNCTLVYTIFRDDEELYILNGAAEGAGLSNKLHHRIVGTNRFARESGFNLTETNVPVDRTVIIETGVLWNSINRIIVPEFDSSTGVLYQYYHTLSVWTETTSSQYDNANFDDGNNLVALAPDSYSVMWTYLLTSQNSTETAIVWSNQQASSLADAKLLTLPPSLPEKISGIGFLVGNIIVKNGDNTATIRSAFDTSFGTGITDHNSTGQLNTGDFLHLTSQDKTTFDIISSSYFPDSASFDIRINDIDLVHVSTQSFNTFTQSYQTDSSSFDIRINDIDLMHVTTQSFELFTQSYISDSSSFDIRINQKLDTGSYLIDSSSFIEKINEKLNSSLFELFTQSYTTDSSSFIEKINQKLNTSSFELFTQSYTTDSSSFNDYIAQKLDISSFNSFTQSNQTDSSSFNTRINQKLDSSSFNSFTQSNITNSSSFDIRINQKLNTSSFNSFTQSYTTDSSSFNIRINQKLDTLSFNTFTQSYTIDSSSFNDSINNLNIVSHSHSNKAVIDAINSTGSSNVFLSGDGTYHYAVTDLLFTSSYVTTTSFNSHTQSNATDSSSFDIRINQKLNSSSFNSFTQSNVSNSSSFDIRINQKLDTSSFNISIAQKLNTSSFNSFTQSYATDSSSFNVYIAQKLDTSSFESFTQSYITDSSSFDVRINQKLDTGSYLTDSSSFNSKINTLTQSFNLHTQSNATDSSSFDIRINQKLNTSSFNSFTSSYTTDSSSFDVRINQKLNSSSFNSFTQSNVSNSSSFDIRINQKLNTSSFNTFTSSYTTDSSSFNIHINQKLNTSSFNTFTSSYTTDSGSFNTRINTISNTYVTTASFNTFTQSNVLNSSSFDVRINQKLNTSSFNTFTQSNVLNSSSFDTRINQKLDSSSFNTFTQSYKIDSASFDTRNTNSVTTFNTFTQSYYVDSGSFNTRINNIVGSVGAFFKHESNAANTTITVAGTYYKANITGSNVYVNGFTASNNNSTMTYIGATTMNFNIFVSAALRCGNQPRVAAIAIYRAGVLLNKTETIINRANSSFCTSIVSFAQNVTTNTAFDIYVTDVTGTDAIKVYDIQVRITSA